MLHNPAQVFPGNQNRRTIIQHEARTTKAAVRDRGLEDNRAPNTPLMPKHPLRPCPILYVVAGHTGFPNTNGVKGTKCFAKDKDLEAASLP